MNFVCHWENWGSERRRTMPKFAQPVNTIVGSGNLWVRVWSQFTTLVLEVVCAGRRVLSWEQQDAIKGLWAKDDLNLTGLLGKISGFPVMLEIGFSQLFQEFWDLGCIRTSTKHPFALCGPWSLQYFIWINETFHHFYEGKKGSHWYSPRLEQHQLWAKSKQLPACVNMLLKTQSCSFICPLFVVAFSVSRKAQNIYYWTLPRSWLLTPALNKSFSVLELSIVLAR